jgi:hypothetical protein
MFTVSTSETIFLTMILFFFLYAATMFAAQSIQLGTNDIVVAGGMESMSNAPKYIAEARSVKCSFCLYPDVVHKNK